MPFQRAYIKAKGFRVGYNLFSLVRLLVSVSLKIDYRSDGRPSSIPARHFGCKDRPSRPRSPAGHTKQRKLANASKIDLK